jgi:hypothetical protein
MQRRKFKRERDQLHLSVSGAPPRMCDCAPSNSLMSMLRSKSSQLKVSVLGFMQANLRPAATVARSLSVCVAERPFRNRLSDVQLIEQSLGLFQIARVKPFREPAVYRSEEIVGLIPLALIAPEPRHAHCGAQFK